MSKEVKAINKMIRTSSQKLNLIIKDIRKKDINAAVNILKFSNKRVSKEVLKTLNSAVANAENNNNLDIDKLVVNMGEVSPHFMTAVPRFYDSLHTRISQGLKKQGKLS